MQKHDILKDHVHAALKFKKFGKQNIQSSIDSAYCETVKKHNDTVRKNIEIIKRLIDYGYLFGYSRVGFQRT